jgi:hypothetical protein
MYTQGVRDMRVTSEGWLDGGLDDKLAQFHRLAEMVGFTQDFMSDEDLQDLFKKVAAAKLFPDNTDAFIKESGRRRGEVSDMLENLEDKLGLLKPFPFMSLKEGLAVPGEFHGVAIWPAGTVNWTDLRLEQIRTSLRAGANFKHIVCLSSSRVCNSAADRKHPLFAGNAMAGQLPILEGEEPTEIQMQQKLTHLSGISHKMFIYPELPEFNEQGKPLSLEQQLRHLQESGQYADLIGESDMYVPSTPNSLYVPLHVRRVLGHDNVWFSQAGALLSRSIPDSWWPSLQALLTYPSGSVRFWIEAQLAGCFTK